MALPTGGDLLGVRNASPDSVRSMAFPSALRVVEHQATEPGRSGHGEVVVLVHGSARRGSSFHPSRPTPPRGCASSPTTAGVTRVHAMRQHPAASGVHIADLLEVAAAAGEGGDRVTAVGHSYGGDVVIGRRSPSWRFASIGAFEPPMPWLGFRRNVTGAGSPAKGPAAPGRGWSPLTEDPAIEAERFFARMVGESSWERLSESGRASRRADGPALVDDLMALRTAAPFDVRTLSVPPSSAGADRRAGLTTETRWPGWSYICHPRVFPTAFIEIVEMVLLKTSPKPLALGSSTIRRVRSLQTSIMTGFQDVVVVRASGPLLFLNQGRGTFRQKPGAFQFANVPQGTFTGAAVADYDRDGWLDILFLSLHLLSGHRSIQISCPLS